MFYVDIVAVVETGKATPQVERNEMNSSAGAMDAGDAKRGRRTLGLLFFAPSRIAGTP